MTSFRHYRVFLGLAFAAAVPLATGAHAVTAPSAAAPSAAAASDPAILATIDGTTVSRPEVESELLRQILERQPDLLEKALQGVIDDRLLTLEASRLGVDRDQLLAREVDGKVAPVSEADIDRFYDEKQAQIRAPKAQVVAQIRAYLENERRQVAREHYLTELRGRHAVENRLAAAREAAEAAQALALRPLIEGGDAPAVGPADAKVALVEFSDFQCPFCGQLTPTIESVRKNYADRVRIVFHQYPLPSLHPFAQKAAEAALCADEQGKFWPMHDLLFAEQDKLDSAGLRDKATRAGLAVDRFNQCVDDGKMAARVAREVELGNRAGVASTTPTMFLNGHKLVAGAIPYEELARRIDDELAKARR